MNTGLQIKVTRDGLSQPHNIEDCTKEEIVTFFESLDPEERLQWCFFLSGHAMGSAHRIKKLEDQLKETLQ